MERRYVDISKFIDDEHIIIRGGRTGRKLHRALIGFSHLYCGRWIKASVRHFEWRGDPTRVPVDRLCERCFPGIIDNQEVAR